MPPITKRTKDKPNLRMAEKVVVEAYDHDCQGGHGPDCRVVDRLTAYTLDGHEITDEQVIAKIESQIQGGT